MGDIKEIVEAIEARLVALGFSQTEEVFDFDSVPNSIVHKAFRLETRLIDNPYHATNISNPKEAIEIWICYHTYRKKRTTQKIALNDRETIEVDLINHSSITGLSCDPVLIMEGEATMFKYLENYLISKITFRADYIKDISGS